MGAGGMQGSDSDVGPGTGVRRRGTLIVACVVAVVCAGAAAVIFGLEGGRGEDVAKALPAASGNFSTAQAQTLETALNSGDPVQVSSVVALGASERFDPSAAARFAGLHLRLDPRTFTERNGNEATVNAVTTGAKTAHWVLLLTKSAGTWKIVATQQVGQ